MRKMIVFWISVFLAILILFLIYPILLKNFLYYIQLPVLLMLTVLPGIYIIFKELEHISENQLMTKNIINLIIKNSIIQNEDLEELYKLALRERRLFQQKGTLDQYCFLFKSIQKMLELENNKFSDFKGLNQIKMIDNLNYLIFILKNSKKPSRSKALLPV